MTLSEVTFVPLFLWKAVALWNVLPMPFFPFLSCLIFNSTEFYSQCSCFIYRRAWISTRWSGCCVKWRSFWKARRCGLQRASGSWSQSWRHFRTLSPRCLRRTSQLASGPLTYVKFYHDNFKGALCKTYQTSGKTGFAFFRIRYFMTFTVKKKKTMKVRSDVCWNSLLHRHVNVGLTSLQPIGWNCSTRPLQALDIVYKRMKND